MITSFYDRSICPVGWRFLEAGEIVEFTDRYIIEHLDRTVLLNFKPVLEIRVGKPYDIPCILFIRKIKNNKTIKGNKIVSL